MLDPGPRAFRIHLRPAGRGLPEGEDGAKGPALGSDLWRCSSLPSREHCPAQETVCDPSGWQKVAPAPHPDSKTKVWLQDAAWVLEKILKIPLSSKDT